MGTVDSANLGRLQALYFHLAGASYEELFDAWIYAESTLARLAAANPDAAAREAAMTPYLSGDVDDVAHDDLDVYMSGHEGFHGALAALADNRVIQVTFRAYGQLVAHHFATVGDVRTIHDVLVDDHLELAQAVLDGDAPTAESLMESHLANVLNLHKEQLGDLLDGDVEWL
ncbi:FCD domain-containing protein [Streptomyces hirsutus]|uniref:FCD domain-containing protein n=1 Tax=Streptomyces hirsutus TaxID=35620 RepID=UPI003632E3F6